MQSITEKVCISAHLDGAPLSKSEGDSQSVALARKPMGSPLTCLSLARFEFHAPENQLVIGRCRRPNSHPTTQIRRHSRHRPQKYTHSSNSARPECETRRLTLPESPSNHTLPVLTAHRKPPSQRQSAARHRTLLRRGPTYSQMCRFDGTVFVCAPSPAKNRHTLRGKYTA